MVAMASFQKCFSEFHADNGSGEHGQNGTDESGSGITDVDRNNGQQIDTDQCRRLSEYDVRAQIIIIK